MAMRINIEMHSQGATYSKKYRVLRECLSQLPFAETIVITQVPSACTSVLTELDKPFLRAYITAPTSIGDEALQTLRSFIGAYAPEYVLEHIHLSGE